MNKTELKNDWIIVELIKLPIALIKVIEMNAFFWKKAIEDGLYTILKEVIEMTKLFFEMKRMLARTFLT